MAITRVCFTRANLSDNHDAIVEFLGALPSGLTLDANNNLRASLPGVTDPVAVCTGTNGSGAIYFDYGFSTSNGLMVARQDGNAAFVITTSNAGTTAAIGKGMSSSAINALDLTNSDGSFSLSGSQTTADITSFTPIVLGDHTYAPKCFACNLAQCGSTAFQMIAGGRSFAYSGLIALED